MASMKRRTRRNPFTHLYKTLGGNNNYSRFVLFVSVFRSASQTRGSARERRGVGSGEKERGEEKRRRGGRRWVRRLSAGLFLRFEHALSFREHGRVNQARDHRENNAVEILLSGNGSSFHRSNLLPPSTYPSLSSPLLLPLFSLPFPFFSLLPLARLFVRAKILRRTELDLYRDGICVQIYS